MTVPAAGWRPLWCTEGGCAAAALATLKRPLPARRRPPSLACAEGDDAVGDEVGVLPAEFRRIKSSEVGAGRAEVLRRAASSSGLQTPGSLRVVTNARLQERYIVTEDVVGQGLTGAVKVVVDKNSRQRRVLKSLNYEEKEDHDRDELLNEMDVYLKLDHPNICRLLEVYAEESSCFLVMELCTGKDLCDRWEARGRYSEQETREVVLQMLSAVQYMHSQGIVHRDLKLENWVYADPSDNARLKLIDFGFSKFVCPGTHLTGILGTIFYVAPEVMQETGYGLECDLWSLGVITHMLLSGVPPFGTFTDDDEEIFSQILFGGGPQMDGPRWLGLSEESRDFVAHLLTRDPTRRPGAKDASQHRWLRKRRGSVRVADEIDVSVLKSLRSFASMNVIKRTACGVIATSMSVYETDELEAQFKRLDTQDRGTISMDELVEALHEHLGMTESDAKELFSRLDLACDGCINYSEFLAATTQRRYMAQEEAIRAAFDRFDTDHSGFISRENLLEVLGQSYMGLKPEDIITQISDTGDGVIRYEDFLKAMMDLGCTERDGPLPGSMEPMKNISRAFDFTSQGTFSPKTLPPKIERKSSCKSLNRGYSTPDEMDFVPEQADGSEQVPVGFFSRSRSFDLSTHIDQELQHQDVKYESPASTRVSSLSSPTPTGATCSAGTRGEPLKPSGASEKQLAQLLSESQHYSDKE